MGVSAILVIWPRPLEQTSVPWTQWRLHMKIGQVVSEEKMFEERGRQTGDGACLYYKLTNEPKVSGELKWNSV